MRPKLAFDPSHLDASSRGSRWMITCALITLAAIALVLVVLVQDKWTSRDSWFAAVFASAVMAMVIDHLRQSHQLAFRRCSAAVATSRASHRSPAPAMGAPHPASLSSTGK
jgi:hypothetical protein